MATIRGGQKLEKALAEIAARLGKRTTLKVGFLEGENYPADLGGQSVAMVAAIQNFGAPARSIPPRPFFSNMVKDKSPEWGEHLAAILRTVNYDAHAALKLMGQGISEQLKDSIQELDEPALSDITLMLRKMRSEDQSLRITGAVVGEAARRLAAGETPDGVSTKPLVYSGTMLNAVDRELDPP